MKIIWISLLISVIIFSSCSRPQWVSNNYKGNVKHDYQTIYSNSTLKLEFNLFALAYEIEKSTYNKLLPKIVEKEIRKEIKDNFRKILFIKADTSLSPNQFYYVGLLGGNNNNKKNYKARSAKSNSIYGIDDFKEINEKLHLGKVFIPLDDKNITILCFNLKKTSAKVLTFYSLSFFKEVINDLFFNNLKTKKEFDNERNISFFEYFNRVSKNANGNYLSLIQELHKIKNVYKDYTDQYFFYEFLATQYAMIDDLDEVKKTLISQDSITKDVLKTGKKITKYVYDDLKWRDAVSEISKRAENFNVTMFNESHFDWRHRHFITILLDSFYKLGYRKLALEALAYTDDSLKIRGFPLQKTGLYVSEPYMANLIRQALRKGFKILSYEDTLDSKNREYYQALNLYNSYKHDTSSKLLVLAGYGHIIEDTNSSNLKMAAYFKKMISTDILTIDQTQYCDLFYEDLFFADKSEGYYSTVNSKGSSGDVTIVNNIRKQPYENVSAEDINDTYKITVSNLISDSNDTSLVLFIYVEKEYRVYNDKSVPIYIKKLSKKNDHIQLNLNKDQYVAVFRRLNGEEISVHKLPAIF